MTEGVIWRQIVAFSAPMAVGLLFQQLYNTVDTVVVGKFVGQEALAAVGSVSCIINMLVGLCAGLATGAGVVISQLYGAHEFDRLRSAVNTTVAVSFILCVLATAAGLALTDPMLMLMKTPPDVYPEAREYLMIYFAGVGGLLIYNMGSGVLRAVGDSRRPLLFLIFSAVMNIILDLVFVLVFHLGVAGVAYATIISQFLSSILVLVALTRTDAPYGIKWKNLRIERGVLASICSIGFPSGIQQAVTSFSNVFVQSYINAFGSVCMAGWSAYNKLDAVILIPVQSIALASTTFVGQNFGAHRNERAREGVRLSLLMSLAVTAVLTAAVVPAARPLMTLFTDEVPVAQYGALFIALISPFYVMICFNQIFAGALRGVGEARAPMVIMLGSFVAFRQLYLYINSLFGGSFIPVAIAYPIGWVVCSVFMAIWYRRSALCRESGGIKAPGLMREKVIQVKG